MAFPLFSLLFRCVVYFTFVIFVLFCLCFALLFVLPLLRQNEVYIMILALIYVVLLVVFVLFYLCRVVLIFGMCFSCFISSFNCISELLIQFYTV